MNMRKGTEAFDFLCLVINSILRMRPRLRLKLTHENI